MAFCDVPIVRARISRLARVANGDATFQGGNINVQRFADDAVRPKMNACRAAILGRVIILKTSRNADDSRFNIRRDLDELFRLVSIARQLVQSADTSDVQC